MQITCKCSCELQYLCIMLNLKVTCDKRRKKNDGTYPIVFRLTFQGERRDIQSGYSCKLKDWDFNQSCLKVKDSISEVTAQRIKDAEYNLLRKLRDFEIRNPDYTSIQQVKEFLAKKEVRKVTVANFWMEEVERLKRAQRFGNARSYETALPAIEMTKSLNISFNRITASWLTSLETDFLERGLKTNTVSVYMRTLRAVYNKAIKDGVANKVDYPFDHFKIKKGRTAPRVATIEELQSYFGLEVEVSDWEYDYWNYGKLIFLLQGINFKDLALLTNDNIKQGRIVYCRSKTGKMISIKILPEVSTIINHYRDHQRLALFPILTNEELKNRSCHPDRISQLRKTTNKWLRRLGVRAGVEEPLSSYVFRYSYANACKSLGYSKDLIAEALSHQYGNSITGIYLEQFDLELVDQMNLHLYNSIARKNID